MAAVLKWIHWFSTDHGVAAMDFMAWTLLASGTFSILLGKKLTQRIAASLDALAERLSPAKIPELSRRIAVGVFGRIGFWVFGAIGVAALVFDIVEVVRAFQLAWSDAPTVGHGLAGLLVRLTQRYLGAHAEVSLIAGFVWAFKVCAVTLTIPAFCLGAMVALRQARKPGTAVEHNAWFERLAGATLKHQAGNEPPQQLMVALVGTLLLSTFAIGMAVVNVVLALLSRLVQGLLHIAAVFADRRRLQFVVTGLGALLKILVFVIKEYR